MKLRLKAESRAEHIDWTLAEVTITDEETGEEISEELACHRVEILFDANEEEDNELVLYCSPRHIDLEVLHDDADVVPFALMR